MRRETVTLRGLAAFAGAVVGAIVPHFILALVAQTDRVLPLGDFTALCAIYGTVIALLWSGSTAAPIARRIGIGFATVAVATSGCYVLSEAFRAALAQTAHREAVLQLGFWTFAAALPLIGGAAWLVGETTMRSLQRVNTRRVMRAAPKTVAPSAAAWARTAETLGLRIVRAYALDRGAMEGSIEGVSVSVRSLEEDGGVVTRLVVQGCPARVEFVAATGEVPGRLGLETFDASVASRGELIELLPLLDAATRASLRSLVAADGVVRGGCIEITVPECLETAGELTRALTPLVRLAKSLTGRAALPAAEALGDLVLHDPDEQVRHRAFAIVLEYFPGVRADALSQQCLMHADLRLRCAAARHLGPAGAHELERLARREDLGADLRSLALESLMVAAPTNGVALAQEIARDATQHEKLRAAAVGALASRTDVEPTLIALVGDAVLSVQLAAIAGLAAVGSAAAVAPLRDGAHRQGSIRVAATSAVEQIQKRLSGAEPGQLTVAPAQGGELGLSDSAGALSPVAPRKQTT